MAQATPGGRQPPRLPLARAGLRGAMAIRSLRVARAYRDFCRASQQTFYADVHAQRALRSETMRTLRQHAAAMSEDAMVTELRSGSDMVRYEIVQASYQQGSEKYRAHITQDHLSRGEVLDLQPPPDPSAMKGG
uniref:Mitochondrial zinc maintenance protein 1, mitochondrial n=1 Tax=Alexandrium monilatum TaxID=311494 RepID=A0A7S4RIL9_9DINO